MPHDLNQPPRGLPRWWRMVVVGLSTLVLCSCRTPRPPLPEIEATASTQAASTTIVAEASQPSSPSNPPVAGVQKTPHADRLALRRDPASASPIIRVAAQSPIQPRFDGPPPVVVPVAGPLPPMPRDDEGSRGPVPFAETVIGPPFHSPIGAPPPHGECIYDGGDRERKVWVTPEWVVQGLEPEDTIGHADTLDGRIIVAPSNRVKIYSPRFSAVRKVVDLDERRGIDGFVRHEQDLGPVPLADAQGAIRHRQNIELRADITDRGLEGFLGRRTPGAELNLDVPAAFQTNFLPFEDTSLIRKGILANADKPILAIGKEAAIAWSQDLGVQVELDGRQAAAATGDRRVHATFAVEDHRGPAKLRVIKIASSSHAQPGDIIAFTIRFDNVGDQLIGNVTILDSLTPRLELIPESVMSSVKADFHTEENDAGSQVLRWEIIDPLPAGEGALVRFNCRVR